MRHFLDILDKFIIALLIVVLSVMLVVGSMQVLWRYVLGMSLSWSEELMRFLYVWATMLGVGAAIRRKSMACIDNFLDLVSKYSPVTKRGMQIAAMIVQIFVFILLLVFGYQFMMRGFGQHSPAMGLPMAYVYAAFPISGVLGLLYTMEEIYDTFLHKDSEVQIFPDSSET